jgi:hypothetical protein
MSKRWIRGNSTSFAAFHVLDEEINMQRARRMIDGMKYRWPWRILKPAIPTRAWR